jgi:ribosomal protein L31E
MAEKLERTYNVPLRRGFIRAPCYRKAKKAVSTLKDFMRQHMKAETIKIGPELNKKIWEHGIKNPPHHVKVTAVKEADVVKVELEGVQFKALEPKKKEEKKTGLKGKLEELTKGKKEAETKEKAEQQAEKEEKKTEAKKQAEPKKAVKEEREKKTTAKT